MAVQMTSRERVQRMFEHREADRIPIWENPWATTLDRWKKQGLKSDDWAEEFGLDKTLGIGCDNSPRYPVKVLWGGCSALNWLEEGKVLEDVETLVPYMKRGGGYIFATDHSVPDNVELEEFRKVISRVKELGRYGY